MSIIRRIGHRLYRGWLSQRFHMKGGMELLEESFLEDWHNRVVSPTQIWKMHRRGFTVDDWQVCKLTEDNYKRYLSSAAYCGMHPINGEYSKWIDDKLTLKYLTYGTKADIMPRYYYSIRSDGRIDRLPDAPEDGVASAEAVLELLRREGCLAVKQTAGSGGAGFYKAEYIDGRYILNGEELSGGEILEKISGLRNYLVMEHLKPHPYFARFCPDTVNCIRYVAARMNGTLVCASSFIRIGTKRSAPVENYTAGGVLSFLNADGEFSKGNLHDSERCCNIEITNHPDTGVALQGKIPCWEKVLGAIQDFSEVFPQLDYMGFDFAVTDRDEVRLLEVNSLPCMRSPQLKESLLEGPAAEFYKTRM